MPGAGLCNELVCRRLKGCQPSSPAILDLHLESAGIADTSDRGWRKYKYPGILDLCEFLTDGARYCDAAKPRILDAVFKRRKRKECCNRVIAVCAVEPGETSEFHRVNNAGNAARNLRHL